MGFTGGRSGANAAFKKKKKEQAMRAREREEEQKYIKSQRDKEVPWWRLGIGRL